MSQWVDIRDPSKLLEGYRRDSDGTRMPGINVFLKEIVEQNKRIIELLEGINGKTVV